jgi:hypothetical protein
LVFSNGIIILGLLAALLCVVFDGDTDSLIPLFAIGVFLSFTLSQAGMVMHWWRLGKQGHQPENDQKGAGSWRRSLVINLLGALATALVVIVFSITKFMHGAWIVVILTPLLVLMFKVIHRHYHITDEQLLVTGPQKLKPCAHTVIVPISRLNNAVLHALEYAMTISNDVRAVYVNVDPVLAEKIQQEWSSCQIPIPLVMLESPYRSLMQPLRKYIDKVDDDNGEGLITVVLPEFVVAKWWQNILHNQSSLVIKAALLFRPGTIVSSVPYHLKR